MELSKQALKQIPKADNIILPAENVFSLPEKVLQFGTGVLLRGLPDFLINKANNAGIFNGRIVIVKSTSGGGDADTYNNQDGLYTVCVRGIVDNKKIDEIHVSAAVSRVLTASKEWDEVLLCAENPEMQVVISNTTEVGITFIKDNVHASPPISFPGKLLAFLYHRYKYFEGDPETGMVIIPTELIPNNGDKLLSVMLELAHQNGLEISFIDWLENSNHFCNSLVDRIVPGKLSDVEEAKVEKLLGYHDGLMIMAEVYALWAIQSGSEKVKKILSFANADAGIIIAKDINKFRELKLRLLNGSHTFSCGLAYFAGFDTVREAMENEYFSQFIRQLMYDEIIPSMISDEIPEAEAKAFADKVLDRYRNAFIDHHWLSITAQYSSKMYLRNGFVIENYYKRFGHAPALMALGMAAHILFLRSEKGADGKYYGEVDGNKYLITDENAALYSTRWKKYRREFIVKNILGNKDLWQADFNELPGFAEEITDWLNILKDTGGKNALKFAVSEKNTVNNEQ